MTLLRFLADDASKVKLIDEMIKWTLIIAPFAIMVLFIVLLYELYRKKVRETNPERQLRKTLKEIYDNPLGLQYYVNKKGNVLKETKDNRIKRLEMLDADAIKQATLLGYEDPTQITKEYAMYAYNLRAKEIAEQKKKEIAEIKGKAIDYQRQIKEFEKNPTLRLTKNEYKALKKKYSVKK